MSDIALRSAATMRHQKTADFAFRYLTALFAALVLFILGGVIIALVDGALPALRTFGFGFLTAETWNPVTETFGALFAGPPLGIGILTAGFILAIMVLPFISSIMRDVFETVPPMLKESAYGLGATRTEVVLRVVLPFTRIGVIGGIMLGLGRALGETMAVTFVIGNAHSISASILQPGTTISASLANEFTEAFSDLYRSSLIALGLILFVITFIVLAIAKFMLLRLQKQAGA